MIVNYYETMILYAEKLSNMYGYNGSISIQFNPHKNNHGLSPDEYIHREVGENLDPIEGDNLVVICCENAMDKIWVYNNNLEDTIKEMSESLLKIFEDSDPLFKE